MELFFDKVLTCAEGQAEHPFLSLHKWWKKYKQKVLELMAVLWLEQAKNNTRLAG